MHQHALARYRHPHDFQFDTHHKERRVLAVILLTLSMMVAEIVAGHLFGSMALLADGWHMGTHVAALGISLFAYHYARRHQHNPLFSFGTGKVSSLGGFASAVALAVVAALMALESTQRLLFPVEIHYDEAMAVAVIGLLVNLLSAWLLDEEHHHHHYEHDHDAHHHHDHNLRAAYLHVLADALTSVLAIVALLLGKGLGWNWVDALMGLVGALIITRWSLGLLRETSAMLLDGVPDEALASELQQRIEADADNRISDLHLWRLGPQRYAAIISLVTHQPREADHYKGLLRDMPSLVHVTVEVNRCGLEQCQ